jgi:hypothetical protein
MTRALISSFVSLVFILVTGVILILLLLALKQRETVLSGGGLSVDQMAKYAQEGEGHCLMLPRRKSNFADVEIYSWMTSRQ